MRQQGWLAVVIGLAWSVSAGAGELVLESGSRLEGELVEEVLVIGTAAGPVEVAAGDVVRLSRDGAWLRDGRVVQGTLRGPHLKARTHLGEMAIRPEDLRSYETSGRLTGRPSPGSATTGRGSEPVVPPVVASGPITGHSLPALASYQDPGGSSPKPLVSEKPSYSQDSATHTSTGHDGVRWLEVVVDGVLLRDAFAAAGRVGRVVRGQQVMLVDYIDRRLRILNTLVLDGGYWIKIRSADGREGWIPADTVRETR